MQQSAETLRGIDYFRDIIQGGKILRLRDPYPVNNGYSYIMQIWAFEKEWYFSLTRSELDDLPGTKSYHKPALALARALEHRFQNVDPNYFVTSSGRLLKIDIEWPPTPWMGRHGLIAASGLWVNVTDLVTKEAARCPVQTTEVQRLTGAEIFPFARPAWVTNTVRSCVDAGFVSFYPTREDLPREFPDFKMQTENYVTKPKSIEDYLAKKVRLLGFKAGGGRREAKTWIADPWDSAYLGCTEDDLREAAAILDAKGEIVLQEDGEFAHVGKILLASEKRTESPASAAKKNFRTIFAVYTPQGSIGEGGSGKVLRVTDQAGSEHALKYLKPGAMSSQKDKRFKNELAFCLKSNHRNIITIEDWGLTEVDGIEVPFYVMPIYPKTLRSLLEEEKNPKLLIPVFLQVLDGVEAAHKIGIWHRDLKPENILFDASKNQVAITDFGIAHFSEELLQTTIETRPQDRLANFRYAAPEQRSGGIVDHRADIYALGLIFYEMLTSELLMGTLHKRIGAFHPDLAALDPLVERMSCQAPSDRPFSIGEIRESLMANLGKSYLEP